VHLTKLELYPTAISVIPGCTPIAVLWGRARTGAEVPTRRDAGQGQARRAEGTTMHMEEDMPRMNFTPEGIATVTTPCDGKT